MSDLRYYMGRGECMRLTKRDPMGKALYKALEGMKVGNKNVGYRRLTKNDHIINKEPKHTHTLKEVFQDSFGWLIRCKECDYEEYIYKIDIVKINSKEGGNKDG